MSSLFDIMGEAAFYLGPDHIILGWNRAAADLTGYSAGEAIGRHCHEILNDAGVDGKSLCEDDPEHLAGSPGGDVLRKIWLHKKNGQRIAVESRSSRVNDAGGTLLGRVAVLRECAGQPDLHRAREEFLTTVSHDLKSPLTSILGFSELMADPRFGEISQKKIEYVRLIQQSGKMLLSLITNIVNSSRIESGQMSYSCKDFSLAGMLEDLHEIFSSQAAQARITLDFSCPQEIWLNADQGKITQVFQNLLSNAIRHTPAEGIIQIRASRDDEFINFTLSDTGNGIAAGDQERVFQKFFHGKGGKHGSGLGLYIVKSILEGHGSSIRLESEEGRGTRFFFRLREGTSPQNARRREGDFLLVGEDTQSCRLIKLILEKDAHKLDYASSGLEGLSKVSQKKYDAVLIHHPLPDIEIEDFCYTLAASPGAEEVPLVLISGTEALQRRDRFALILPLPINMPWLRESMQKILQRV